MIWAKRGFALAALGVVLYLFWPLVGEIRAAAALFKHARWEWLAIAIAIQAISYGFLTWLNDLALRPFPGRISFRRLAALLTSMAFIEIAIPSAGASGLALRARLLGKHGRYSLEASLFSLVLETLFEGIAVATVCFFGLVYLLQIGGLTATDLGSLSVSTVLMVGVIWGGWWFINQEERLERSVTGLAKLWNHVAGRLKRVDLSLLAERLEVFQASLANFRTTRRWKFWLAAYGKVVFDIATLGACFLLFNRPIPYDTLIVGYGLTLLLSGLASLPGGLGIADVSVPVIFSQLGMPGSVALAAGLTYRLIAFWSIRFIGFVSWQVLENASDSPPSVSKV